MRATILLFGSAALALAACQSPMSTSANSGPTANSSTQGRPAADREAERPDPQMKAVLDQYAAMNPKPLPTLSAPEARMQPSPADAVKALLQKQGKSTAPERVAEVMNRTIPGPGGQIPVRIYMPANAGSGPLPVIVYYHGGGWVIANLDTYDASARALANAANAIVVSSHYRQAPEFKFPAAHEDAWAAYRWTVENARSINGDPRRIAVAGESAGGNLAGAVALNARRTGFQMPVHQLLIYPIAGTDLSTPSYQENAQAKPLNKDTMAWFFDKYLPSQQAADNPLVALNQAQVNGLPGATVITAEIDPLRSEGAMYAERLRQAGVPVTFRLYEGVTHEFFGMGAAVDKAKQAQQFAGEQLRQAFASAAQARS